MSTAVSTLSAKGLRVTLGAYRVGRYDPTTQLGLASFARATLTPEGPGTILIRWASGRPTGARSHGRLAHHDVTIEAEAWGPGASWLLGQAPAMTGTLDNPQPIPDLHPAVTLAARNHPYLRIGASGNLYHELLPTLLAQRITSAEATAQWRRLVHRLGAPAPGPVTGLMTPPEPHLLASQPVWWFHPLGIEAKRANALKTVARHAAHLWEWSKCPPAECASRLASLRGVGEWTVGSVLGPALGCADSIAVGDYHLKNIVAHALTGRARGTDEQMMALLEPFRPQRGRVTRLLGLDGHRAPKFGPRQRIMPMQRW
jgi:3-methyladenine DNA glycosylase/8-oxoguanine DNA glycosylase